MSADQLNVAANMPGSYEPPCWCTIKASQQRHPTDPVKSIKRCTAHHHDDNG
jgi:hypothetical protein